MPAFYFYFPPLHKVSGGMRVIAALAAHLVRAGRDASLVIQNLPEAPAAWLSAKYAALPLVKWRHFRPGDHDWYIVPEGWPLALKPGLLAHSRCVVYAQSWTFVHGHLPPGVFWQKLPVRFWAVSTPVAQFIRETTGHDAPIVPPAIDGAVFHPGQDARAIRSIAWMPRKNKGITQQTRQILEAIRFTKGAQGAPTWVEIDGKTTEEVAAIMRNCQIFFASGFPEGCPLPPLEAMASGCLVCGFAGFGGWDYMRQGWPEGVSPPLNLPARTWGPNGFYAADADTFGAAKILDHALDIADTGERQAILANAAATAAFYSANAQKEALFRAIAALEDAF